MNTDLSKNQVLRAVKLAKVLAFDYVNHIHERRVYPSKQALLALKHFDETLPETECDPEEILKQLHQYASPATVASTGGRYFGLVVGGTLPASLGASLLAGVWDQVAALENSAPSAIYLERLASQWLLQLLSLPTQSSVGFTTGSSLANLVCLTAARNALYQALNIDLLETGLSNAPALTVYVSEQAHVTVLKALNIIGIGRQQIVSLPCDDQGRILMKNLPDFIPHSIVCLQAGNVNSGASDPFSDLIPLAHQAKCWVHVDGAFGLWAAASTKTQHLVEAVETADSWAVDGHKWLNTPYDCGIAICRHPEAVHQVMATQAPYLSPGLAMPPKDMVPEFSRRARGVEVWAAIKELGQTGIAKLVDRCCLYAQQLATGLEQAGFTILNDVVLNQVVATLENPVHLDQIHKQIEENGICWFGKTHWQGQAAIRLSVSSWVTDSRDIETVIHEIQMVTQKVVSIHSN